MGKGVALAFLLHLLQIPLGMLTSTLSLWSIGLSQLVYILPSIFIARHKGQRGIMKGLIIGASVTFLLNAACFGFFIVAMNWGGMRIGG